MQKKNFIIEKIQKSRKCPALKMRRASVPSLWRHRSNVGPPRIAPSTCGWSCPHSRPSPSWASRTCGPRGSVWGFGRACGEPRGSSFCCRAGCWNGSAPFRVWNISSLSNGRRTSDVSTPTCNFTNPIQIIPKSQAMIGPNRNYKLSSSRVKDQIILKFILEDRFPSRFLGGLGPSETFPLLSNTPAFWTYPRLLAWTYNRLLMD